MPKGSAKILLFDANALIHRAFHAVPPLTSPKGELVNAVYGFANTLLKAIKDEAPTYAVVCFDKGRRTFRHEIFAEYKAKRKETDESLALQIPRTKELSLALNIPLYEKAGLEADDLIGSLAAEAKKRNLQVVIVTGDGDAFQLSDETTKVYKLQQGLRETVLFGPAQIKQKLGVSPQQVVDYKALSGDSSDNIPGVPGVGPKTAVSLLEKYGSLEQIYAHLDEVPEKVRSKLERFRELAFVSRRLATIKTDAKIELDLEAARVANFDFRSAVAFFHELGFKSLISKIPAADGHEPVKSASVEPKKAWSSITVTDEKSLSQLAKRITEAEKIVVDTETVALNDKLIGLAIYDGHNAYYVPSQPHPQGLDSALIKKYLARPLAAQRPRKIGHNLKYDLKTLIDAGFELGGVYFDTMLASTLVNTQLFSARLDDLAEAELNHKMIPLTELMGEKKNKPLTSAPLEKLAEYACEDAAITWRLFEKFAPEVEERQLKKVFYEIEMPVLPVLEKMERVGIKVNLTQLKRLESKLATAQKRIEAQIYQLAGEPFNINSPAQLQEVLFKKLKLPLTGIRRTQSGHSTDADALGKLASKHPIAELLLEWREISKIKNTYVDTLPQLTDRDGRLHTSFQQLGAATGRLSSSNPNLQNIPTRTELGREVRRSFIAEKGKQLLSADYSQAELRVVAHLSQDEKLIESFERGEDIHQTVSSILNVNRRLAKAINFGIIYGLGPKALAADLGISTEEARDYINQYLYNFPKVAAYMERAKAEARELGYVSSVFGRRRYLPDIHSPNQMLRSAAERMAVNMPAQGTVADIVKLAMVEVDKILPKTEAVMLLQIHDELLFEIDKPLVGEMAQKLARVMRSVAQLRVPMEVSLSAGDNWAELSPL